MNTLIKAAMKVAPALAKRIVETGAVEIVTRLADGKIAAITKVPVDLLKDSNMVLSALRVAKFASPGPVLAVNFLKIAASIGTMQKISSFIKSADTAHKEMLSKLDVIGASVSSVKKLTYLNSGIGLINLGVGVSGIVYIGKRLNDVQMKLDKISNQIGQIRSILTSEKISDYHNLSMRFGAITNRLSDGDSADRKEIEGLLIDMRTFSSEMIRNFYYDAMDAEIILEIVFNLLAAYTALLNIYIREYYFEKGRLPDNLESYTSLYDALTDSHFSKLVQDYLVIKKGMTIREAINAIQVQKLLVANCMLQYKDQIDILSIVETKDRYMSLMKITDKYVESEIERLIPKVAEETGIENCREVIREALAAQVAYN